MRFRFRTLAIIFLLGGVAGAAGVFALLPPRDAAKPAPAGLSASELALDKVLPEVWLDNAPLNQAVQKVSNLAGVPIEIDQEAMAKERIAANCPITVRVRNASLATVLDQLTKQVTEFPSVPTPSNVTWILESQRIRITTADQDKDLYTRVYEAADLLNFPASAPEAGGCCFGPVSSTRAEVPKYTYAQDSLANLITETIAPENWRQNGGYGGIHFLGGRMVVTQTLKNHRTVRDLLGQIRESPGPPPPINSSPNLLRWQPEVEQWVPVSTEVAEAELRKLADRFATDAESLTTVADRFRKVWQIPVVVEPGAAKLMEGRRFTFGLRETNGFDVLEALLVAANGTPPRGATQPADAATLGWTIDQGILRFIKRSTEQDDMTVTRVYDIRQWTKPEAGRTKTHEELTEQLVKILMESVDPDSWRENGGMWGSAKELSGYLVVTQTFQNQEKVRKLLESLPK